MARDVIFTLGIVIAILFLLLFLRSAFLRHANTQRQAALNAAERSMRGVSGTSAGVWSGGGMDGIGFGRRYGGGRVDVARPAPAAFVRSDTDREGEGLPRYEAPPPKYDTVVKDTTNEEGNRDGEPSTSAQPNVPETVVPLQTVEPPAYEGRSDFVVNIQQENPNSVSDAAGNDTATVISTSTFTAASTPPSTPPVAETNPFRSNNGSNNNVGTGGGEFRVDMERTQGGMFGR